jgi:hypothetical protein
MKHAYFADMGGLVLQTPGWKQFPINGKQLHYLITNGPKGENNKSTGEMYLDYPEDLNIGAINDRNNWDGLSRCVAPIILIPITVNYLI